MGGTSWQTLDVNERFSPVFSELNIYAAVKYSFDAGSWAWVLCPRACLVSHFKPLLEHFRHTNRHFYIYSSTRILKTLKQYYSNSFIKHPLNLLNSEKYWYPPFISTFKLQLDLLAIIYIVTIMLAVFVAWSFIYLFFFLSFFSFFYCVHVLIEIWDNTCSLSCFW